MGTDNYAFPDLPQFDEILCGEWVEGKSPSSIVMRQFLARAVRFHRSEIRSRKPERRQAELQFLRQMYRQQVAGLVEMEPRWLKLRDDIQRVLLPVILPEGGIQ